MQTLKLLGKCVAYYILMYVIITIMIPVDWQQYLLNLSSATLAIAFFIALFQLLLGDPGWGFLETLRKRIVAALFILISIMAVAGFGIESIINLFE